jgi:hypothetical protein
MKLIKATLLLSAILLGAIPASQTFADGRHFTGTGHRAVFVGGHSFHGGHSHSSFGVVVGVPLFNPFFFPPYYGYGYGYGYPGPYYPPYYGSPYYYPQAAGSPPVYVEQGSDQGAAPQSNYWYYCSNPDGYYPYVKECPGGWQRVVPQPPSR